MVTKILRILFIINLQIFFRSNCQTNEHKSLGDSNKIDPTFVTQRFSMIKPFEIFKQFIFPSPKQIHQFFITPSMVDFKQFGMH